MLAIELESLTKRYGRTVAVDSVSLQVEPGSVYGLLGPNGSGKTTALACALGLLRPSSGRVSVLGQTPRHVHRTRGRLGVVFDAPILVRGLTVRQQLSYVDRFVGERGGRSVDEGLELVELTDLARRPVTVLSLGQSKRLAIAAALLGRPELIVLDEPLSGLDPPGVRALLNLLRTLAADGLTIVLSTHRLHEVEPVLSHAAILLRGRLARAGPMGLLLQESMQLRLVADDPERARRLLEGLQGVHARTGDDRSLVIEPGPHAAAELNRALVQAGVAVSELRREGGSLAALFQSLVDAGGGGQATIEVGMRPPAR